MYDLPCFKITLSCPRYGSISSIRKAKFVYPPDNDVMDFAAHGVAERYCATCLESDKSSVVIVGYFWGDGVVLSCKGGADEIRGLGLDLGF